MTAAQALVRRWLLAIAVAPAIIALAAHAIAFADTELDQSSPEALVRTAIEAWLAGDIDAVNAAHHPDEPREPRTELPSDWYPVRLARCTIDGDWAALRLRIARVDDDGSDVRAYMTRAAQREGDDWYLVDPANVAVPPWVEATAYGWTQERLTPQGAFDAMAAAWETLDWLVAIDGMHSVYDEKTDSWEAEMAEDPDTAMITSLEALYWRVEDDVAAVYVRYRRSDDNIIDPGQLDEVAFSLRREGSEWFFLSGAESAESADLYPAWLREQETAWERELFITDPNVPDLVGEVAVEAGAEATLRLTITEAAVYRVDAVGEIEGDQGVPSGGLQIGDIAQTWYSPSLDLGDRWTAIAVLAPGVYRVSVRAVDGVTVTSRRVGADDPGPSILAMDWRRGLAPALIAPGESIYVALPPTDVPRVVHADLSGSGSPTATVELTYNNGTYQVYDKLVFVSDIDEPGVLTVHNPTASEVSVALGSISVAFGYQEAPELEPVQGIHLAAGRPSYYKFSLAPGEPRGVFVATPDVAGLCIVAERRDSAEEPSTYSWYRHEELNTPIVYGQEVLVVLYSASADVESAVALRSPRLRIGEPRPFTATENFGWGNGYFRFQLDEPALVTVSVAVPGGAEFDLRGEALGRGGLDSGRFSATGTVRAALHAGEYTLHVYAEAGARGYVLVRTDAVPEARVPAGALRIEPGVVTEGRGSFDGYLVVREPSFFRFDVGDWEGDAKVFEAPFKSGGLYLSQRLSYPPGVYRIEFRPWRDASAVSIDVQRAESVVSGEELRAADGDGTLAVYVSSEYGSLRLDVQTELTNGTLPESRRAERCTVRVSDAETAALVTHHSVSAGAQASLRVHVVAGRAYVIEVTSLEGVTLTVMIR